MATETRRSDVVDESVVVPEEERQRSRRETSQAKLDLLRSRRVVCKAGREERRETRECFTKALDEDGTCSLRPFL